MTKSISEAEAKAQLTELLTQVAEHDERIVINRDDMPIAVLISLPELARLTTTQKTETEKPGEPEWKGFQSLIGLWHDVDPAEIDKMVVEIYAARERDLGRPVDLSDCVEESPVS